jgi:tRNA A64-2'-O-ribosylphosphate transferase
MKQVLQEKILPRLQALHVKLPALKKPLRPIWISPASMHLAPISAEVDFIPVYCVTASRQINDAEEYRSENFVYIQGAGDDEENWARGLTPEVFWNNVEQFLSSEESCYAQIQNIPKMISEESSNSFSLNKISNSCLYIGSRRSSHPTEVPWEKYTHIINCTNLQYPSLIAQKTSSELEKTYLYLDVAEGKKGQHQLFAAFPKVESWFRRNVLPMIETSHVLVHCNQGRDRSVVVALLLYLKFIMAESFDIDNGQASGANNHMNSSISAVSKLIFYLYIRVYKEARSRRPTCNFKLSSNRMNFINPMIINLD